MILRTILAASLLALQSSAFLIPEEIADAVAAAKARLPELWKTQGEFIELPCPGCTFAGPGHDGVAYDEADENTIAIQVIVEEAKRLKINGKTVFPLDMPLSPVTITAPQIRKSDGHHTRPLTLGYALEIESPLEFEGVDGKILPVQFTILDMEGVSVNVDTLKIELLEDDKGLTLAKVSTVPFKQTPGAEECSTSICRIRAIVAAHLNAIMEAAKAKAHAAGKWAKGGCHGKQAGGGRHGKDKEGHHHRHGGHHHKMHRFGRILHQTLRFLVVPALLGVIGGLMASAIGMLVGQAIVYVWVRVHRNGRRGNIRVIESEIVEGEKDALVDATEAPPLYEDVETIIVEEIKE